MYGTLAYFISKEEFVSHNEKTPGFLLYPRQEGYLSGTVEWLAQPKTILRNETNLADF